MCNRLGSAAYTLVLLIFTLGVSSCVLIPYEPTPEVSLSADGHLPAGEMIVHVEPHELLEQISEAIAEADTRIEVTDPVAFRDSVFTDWDWRVSRLFEEGNARRVSNELGVDYLVLIGEMEKTILSDVDYMGWFIVFFGAAYKDVEDRLSATIINLQSEHHLYDVSSSARGVSVGIGYAYLVAVYPKTESSVIEGLGRRIADTIINNKASEKVRIAVLAVDLPDEAYVSYIEKQKALEVLQERARQGEPDAQWELYRELPTEENLIWLCQAADFGQAGARYELGKLYFYGSGRYRNFEKVKIPSDLSMACMWSHLAGQAQIIDEPGTEDIDLTSVAYDSAEVERTAKVMTTHELEEAAKLINDWEPGQCDRDFALYLGAAYTQESSLAGLCTAADHESMSARESLGRLFFFGSKGVDADLPRAYMWYHLAAQVYVPPDMAPDMAGGSMQFQCDSMNPEQRSVAVKLLEEWEPGKCEEALLQ